MTDNKISAETLLKVKILHLVGATAKSGKYSSKSVDALMDHIKELSDQRCKEQREICATKACTHLEPHGDKWLATVNEDSILNAPPPK